MATQEIDYKQKNDRLHVLLNEQIDQIANFRTQITLIDRNLTDAQRSLAGINGVDAALKGIQQSQNENYQRLANVQRAEEAERELFIAIGEKYTVLQQAVAALNIPDNTVQNPQLTMGQQNTQSTNQTAQTGQVVPTANPTSHRTQARGVNNG